MSTLSLSQLKQRRQAALDQFREFRKVVEDGYDQVETAMEQGQYREACEIMTRISQGQASASVKMRNTLIKFGFVSREGSND